MIILLFPSLPLAWKMGIIWWWRQGSHSECGRNTDFFELLHCACPVFWTNSCCYRKISHALLDFIYIQTQLRMFYWSLCHGEVAYCHVIFSSSASLVVNKVVPLDIFCFLFWTLISLKSFPPMSIKLTVLLSFSDFYCLYFNINGTPEKNLPPMFYNE